MLAVMVASRRSTRGPSLRRTAEVPGTLRTLGRAMLGSQRPLWRLVERRGPLNAAPVATVLLMLCLTVSGLWASPGLGHRLAAGCCAYRGWHPSLGPSVRLVASAFLLRHGYEVTWTIAATILVIGPLEALLGSWRALTVMALGHLVPTVAVALAGVSQNQRLGGGGLDVGASAMVVAAAAGLAVRSRSVAVAAWLVVAQSVGILLQSPLASVEHLLALSTGASLTLALSARPARSRQHVVGELVDARRRPTDHQ